MRTAVMTTVAVTAAVAAGLAVVFWVALEPIRSGCNISLLPGAYRDAMLPAHLVALAALGAAAAWLDARTATDGRVPLWTRVGLGLAGFLAAVWVLLPTVGGLLGLLAAFAAPLLGVPLLAALALRTLLVVRRGGDGAWTGHAVTARVLVWSAIVLGLPGHVAYAWLEGASAFCF